MVAATQGAAYAPGERPRVAIAGDGTLAVIHEPARAHVLELPGCAAFAELELDAAAASCELAWIGAPPRLVVVEQFAAHSLARLVDPFGPRTIAQLRLDTPARLHAAVGSYALAIGPSGAMIVAASETQLVAYPLPARGVPVAVGAAAGNFVVALQGTIDEWDPHERIPKHRIKLPHAGTVTAVGGSDRVVWCTWQGEPARVDAFARVDRGQPRTHELPEPIARVAAHPRSDLLVCLGAETGRIYVVDLDGRRGLRVIGPEGIDRAEAIGLVNGRVGGVLAAQARRPVAVVTLERPDSEPVRPPSFVGEDAIGVAEHAHAPSAPGTATWRDALVAWRAARAATPPPAAPAVDALIVRSALAMALRPAIALLYAAHLAGDPGAAPVELARVAGWPEALGRGELAARGVASFDESRIKLAPEIQRVLDAAE
ncbi:MAG: hypothetical protein ACM31C_17050 [Acidobacteriota bacterium]